MIYKHILLITFLNEPKLVHLHTIKWFQVFVIQFRIIQVIQFRICQQSQIVPNIAMYH